MQDIGTAGKRPPQRLVPKGWGQETWICNSAAYCGKELVVLHGRCGSAHFHKRKDETFYVLAGRVRVRFGTLPENFPVEDADQCRRFAERMDEVILDPGDVFHAPPGLVHQCAAIAGDARIIEFSTHHDDADTYRLVRGD